MFRTPRQFVLQNVLPAYRSFFEFQREGKWGQSQLVRLGLDAAVALYHLAEHLPTKPTHAHLEAQCADFTLVRDIANASKHNTLTRGKSQISNASQIAEVNSVTEYCDNLGTYSAPRVEVLLTLDDGRTRDLADVLQKVMTMWCEELRNRGIIDIQNPEGPVVDTHIPREEAERRSSALELLQGEDHQLTFALRRFNYVTNQSEPVDLTGCKARMEFRGIPKCIPIRLDIAKEDWSILVEHDIPLTPEQGQQLIGLRTVEEKEQFTQRLLQTQPELKKGLSAAIRRALAAKGDDPPDEHSGAD